MPVLLMKYCFSDNCPQIVTAIESRVLRFRTQPFTHFKDKVLNCFWQVKVPDGPENERSRLFAYVNITDVKLSGKYLLSEPLLIILLKFKQTESCKECSVIMLWCEAV